MKTTILNDPRTIGLFHRVTDDVSQLKSDIGELLGDTTRRVLPEGARQVSKITRKQLAAGRDYARAYMSKGSSMPKVNINHATSLGILGGALVVGVLAIGYYLAKDHAVASAEAEAAGPDLLVSPHN